VDGDAAVPIEKETFYLPASSNAERYARELAPSIYSEAHKYRYANYSADDIVVLVPAVDMIDGDMAQDVHGGSIIGYPMKLVNGIDAPMLAVELKRTKLP
jgi:hypothetical protein